MAAAAEHAEIAATRREEYGLSASTRSGRRRGLPPWTPTKDDRHTQLMTAVTATAEALRAARAEAGISSGYDTMQDLHKAARAQ